MKIKVATLFPEVFDVLKSGIIGKALDEKKFEVELFNIRDYSTDKHHRCDDYPFGGGAGMVMTCQPLMDCINSVDKNHDCKRIYMSPRGKTLTQQKVLDLAKLDNLLIVCGSYEGIDERVIENEIDEQISIGDYVLTSGDLPALVLINSISRFIPGVLGSSESVEDESFMEDLLEYPQYSRPADYKGLKVPDVLLSGNHQKIAEFRKQKQIQFTKEFRPDLYEKYIDKKRK